MDVPRTMTKLALFALFLICSLIYVPADAFSAEITIGWNRPDSSQVAGYNIYYGESGTDFKSIPGQRIESPDTTQLTILGLEDGLTYAFAVTSVDALGNESDFSDVVAAQVPLPADDDDDDGDTYTEKEGDCNDNDASIYPGADEICGDGIDQDCNGSDLACSEGAVGADGENPSDSADASADDDGGGGGGGGCFITTLFSYLN